MNTTVIEYWRDGEYYSCRYQGVRGKLPAIIAAHKVAGDNRLERIPSEAFKRWLNGLRQRGTFQLIQVSPQNGKSPAETQAQAQDQQESAVDVAQDEPQAAPAKALPETPMSEAETALTETWQQLLLALMRARRPAIAVVGEPGVGKTYTVSLIARILGVELLIVDGHAQLMPTDFVGRPTFVQDEKGAREVWRAGYLEQARARNAVLLVNEADALTPDTLIAIVQSLSANPLAPSYALSGDGRRIDFSDYPCTPVVLTMNTRGQGEGTQYTRHGQDAAILDRLTFVEATQRPIATVLAEVSLNGKTLADYQVSAIEVVAKRVRKALHDHGFLAMLTNRDLMRIGQQVLMLQAAGFPTAQLVRKAFEIEWLTRYPLDDRDALKHILGS